MTNKTFKLVSSTPTYSCTRFFQDTGENIRVWIEEINTMSGMGFGRRVSTIKTLSREEARLEWKKRIAWGEVRID